LKFKKEITAILIALLTTFSAFGDIPTGYYDAASGKSGEQLKTALNTILNTNLTRVSYGDSRYILDETDRDPANSNNCILVYLGTSVSGTWDGTTWNREHVWPQSLLNVDVNNNSINVGSDLHNLKPADPNENSSRGNKYFANQTTSASYAPRNAVKGDLARTLFYMVVMYESSPDLELVNRAPDTYEMALLDILLEWHVQDPVDDFERNRNEVIYSYQHNRNPFIDHPEYINLIWGTNLPPNAPSQLTASAISYTSLTLNWTDNATDESGFRIYQNDSLIVSTTANVTTSSITGLTAGKSYTFSVTAWNANGESASASLTTITLSIDTTENAIFFSEYIEGSSANKALEIVNSSTAAVNLDKYKILMNANNGTWYTTNYTFPSGTILNPGAVWVIVHPSAESNLKIVADDTSNSSVVNFNGDDVRALVIITGVDTTIIDIIGTYKDPDYNTNGWEVAGVSAATTDHTLVRKPAIQSGNSSWTTSAGTDSNNSEWIVYSKNTSYGLGSHFLNPDNLYTGNQDFYVDGFYLFPAFPNPFNHSTRLCFELPLASDVAITIFNLNGQCVDEINPGHLAAGRHELIWDGMSYISGLYLYQIRSDNQVRSGKIILLK